MNLRETLPPTLLVIVGAIFLFLIIYVASNGNKDASLDSAIIEAKKDSTKMDSTAKAETKKDIPPKPSNWSYDTTKDEMTSRTTIIASTMSTNEFEFKEPYNGDNYAEIQIRKRRGNTDVILSIQKGQFIGGVEGQNIKIRFDEKRYSTYYCSSSNDYDPTVLFINNAEDFIGNLKKAKKVIIEATIYDNGYQQFDFNVDGFKWNQSHHHSPNMTIIPGRAMGWHKNKKGQLEFGYLN